MVCEVNMWTQQGRGVERREDGRGQEEGEEGEEEEEEKAREDSSGVAM